MVLKPMNPTLCSQEMRREARQRREETRKDKDRVEKASVGDTGVIGGAVEGEEEEEEG